MNQHIGGENQARSRVVRSLTCDHHFHVVHVSGSSHSRGVGLRGMRSTHRPSEESPDIG